MKALNNNQLCNQYTRLKSEAPDMILFIEMGDFFEIWSDDAVVSAPLMDVALSQRGTYADGTPMPICGVPAWDPKRRIISLLEGGHAVAVAKVTEGKPVNREIFLRFWPEQADPNRGKGSDEMH